MKHQTRPSEYTYTLCNLSDDINRSDWESVSAHASNPFMDVRFFRAVEKSITEPGKYWYAIVYDKSRVPIACACFSLFAVDAAMLAPDAVQRQIHRVRRWCPRFFRFKILLCGLPVSTGGGQVVATRDVDWGELAVVLDRIACQLARSERIYLISFKEYDEELTGRLSKLMEHGYRRAESVTIYTLDTPYGSFEEYYRCRSKRTRANIRKVFAKLEDAGLRYVWRKGGEGVAECYTDEVHQLYEAVYARAKVKFEHLPAAFFREFAKQFPENSRFTFLYQEERVVGFCCALASDGHYDMLYCGIDYERNASADIYFNIMYRALEDALNGNVESVTVGASADEFKRRMGCRAMPLSIYVKAPGVIPSIIFHRLFGFLFG